MVNVDRVKHQCGIAFYEQQEEKRNRGVSRYFRSDYIGKEVIKSIFTGSIAYFVMVALWAMANVEAVLQSVNDWSIINTIVVIACIYVAFLATYLLMTYVIYVMRYAKGKKKLERYKDHIKALHQMYEREEKLKL